MKITFDKKKCGKKFPLSLTEHSDSILTTSNEKAINQADYITDFIGDLNLCKNLKFQESSQQFHTNKSSSDDANRYCDYSDITNPKNVSKNEVLLHIDEMSSLHYENDADKTNQAQNFINLSFLELETEDKAIVKKSVIADEVQNNVYFKYSSETPDQCIKRITLLMTDYQRKLIEYQSRNPYRAKWGLPILTGRYIKEDLLRNVYNRKDNLAHSGTLRETRSAKQSNVDPYSYLSSGSENSDINSPYQSDEEWNIFKTERKAKKKLPADKKKTALAISTISKKKIGNDITVKEHGPEVKNVISDMVEKPLPKKSTDKKISESPQLVPVNKSLKEENTVIPVTVANISTEIKPKSQRRTVPATNVTSGWIKPSLQRKSFKLKKVADTDISIIDSAETSSAEDFIEEIPVSEEVIYLKRPLEQTVENKSHKKLKSTGFQNPVKDVESKTTENVPESTRSYNTVDKHITTSKTNDKDLSDNRVIEITEALSDTKTIAVQSSTAMVRSVSSIPEVTIIGDIECPMCNQMFPRQEVEAHAADCEGPPCVIHDDGILWPCRRLRPLRRN